MLPATTTSSSIISNVIGTIEQTSRTYKIDFEKKRITGKIDNVEALKQTVFCILNTARYEYIIYSHNYGTEFESAIGLDYELAKSEIQRYIEEAILADDRFVSVNNFKFERKDLNSLIVTCNIDTIYGLTLNVEQKVGV